MKKKSDSTFSWFVICVAVSALTFVGLFSGLLLYEKAFLIASIIGVAMFLMMFDSKNMEFLYLSGGLIISLQGLDLPNFNPLGFVGALLIVVTFIIGWIYIHRRKLPVRDALIYLFILLVNILGFAVMFIDFSSQYIWFPVVGLLFLNLMLLMEKCFRSENDKTIMFSVSVIALAVGIISTLVQFWTSEIILGMDLWLVLLLLGTLTGIVLTLVKDIKKNNARRRTEKKRQEIDEAAKKRKEKLDADAAEVKKRQDELQAKQDELKAKIDELMEIGDILSDKDIYFLISNVKPSVLFGKNGLKKCFPGDFIKKLPLALSEVSEIKKQIIWPNSLAKNLEFIENAIKASSIDPFIRICVSKVYDFLAPILDYGDYKGQCEIFSFILTDCSCTMSCMSEIYNKENKETSIFPKFLLIQKYLEIIQREK